MSEPHPGIRLRITDAQGQILLQADSDYLYWHSKFTEKGDWELLFPHLVGASVSIQPVMLDEHPDELVNERATSLPNVFTCLSCGVGTIGERAPVRCFRCGNTTAGWRIERRESF